MNHELAMIDWPWTPAKRFD